MTNVSIEPADPTTAHARVLLEASHALMGELFPRDANHFLSVEKLRAPHINFFVAKDVDDVLGCAALADHGSYGEVKSMFVAPHARKRGVAHRLLSHLEDTARSKAMTTLRLETGQPGLDSAHRLYERHGFKDCAAFGDYEADAPYSRYMELKL